MSVGLCREYIQTVLPAFKARHPDVEVFTVKRRNQFPLVKAEYGENPVVVLCWATLQHPFFSLADISKPLLPAARG